jgi:hypothetical protein
MRGLDARGWGYLQCLADRVTQLVRRCREFILILQIFG